MKLLKSLCFGACCIATYTYYCPAFADEEKPSAWTISGNSAFKTDYVFRGFSQTDEEPAVQGTIAVAHDSGFSASLWGSNVDFNDGDEASTEVDATTSYTLPLGPGDFTLGGIYYAYPRSDSTLNYDYIEGFAGYAFDAGDIATITTQVFYSPDYFAASGDSVYAIASFSAPVPAVPDFSLSGSVAHQWIEDNAKFGAEDYTTWSAGGTYTWEKVSFDVTYYDTDIADNDCSSLCDQRVVGSIGYSF